MSTPGSTSPPVRIAHVSDIHVGAHDELTLDGLAEDLRAADVTATVVTGDLTMRARSHEFARARDVIERFPSPTMVVIGNHDIPLTNPVRRMSSPYRRYRAEVTAVLDPVLDLGGVRIQGLGSMPRWRWKSGRISDRQADLIRHTLSDAPPGVARVVALHHPPSSDDWESIAGGREFERALVEAEVDVVLAGHTHVPAVTALHLRSGTATRSVVEVVAGTATSQRTRGVQRSWTLLEFSADTLTVIEHHARPGGWSPGAPARFPLHSGAPPQPGASS